MTDLEKAAIQNSLVSAGEDGVTAFTTGGKEDNDSDETLPPSQQSRRMDGGLKAWLAVAGCSASLFCAFGQLSAFGTFQTYYADHQLQGLPTSAISWIGSIQFWTFFFSVSFWCA